MTICQPSFRVPTQSEEDSSPCYSLYARSELPGSNPQLMIIASRQKLGIAAVLLLVAWHVEIDVT
jgi:hypothetical protein